MEESVLSTMTNSNHANASLTQSDRYAIAFQLVTQLVEAPPEAFAKRIAVLRNIKEAWENRKEVVMVTEEENVVSYKALPEREELPTPVSLIKQELNEPAVLGTVVSEYTRSNLDEDTLFEKLGSLRAEVSLQKINHGDGAFSTQAGEVDSTIREEEDFEVAENDLKAERHLEEDLALNMDDSPDDYHVNVMRDRHSEVENTMEGIRTSTPPRSPQKRRSSVGIGRGRALLNDLATINKTAQPRGKASSMSKRPFPCPICPKRFKQKSHLNEHVRRHTQDRRFPCLVCSKRFFTAREMRMHNQNIHLRRAATETSPTSNLKSGHPSPGREPNSNTTAVRSQKVNKWQQSLSEMPSTSQHKPGTRAAKEGRIKPVSISESPRMSPEMKQSFSCEVCKFRFATKSALTTHMMKGHFMCQICGMVCLSRKNLLNHQKVHAGKDAPDPPKSAVKRAPALATRVIRKKYERLRVNKKVKGGFQCTVCHQVLRTAQALATHQESHTCKVCSKVVSSISLHMRVHTDERPFECPQCSVQFKQRAHLKYHWMTIHHRDVYECHHCIRFFLDPEELKDHELKHNKAVVKPKYFCRVCGRGLSSPGHLAKHERLHSKKKPLSCVPTHPKRGRKPVGTKKLKTFRCQYCTKKLRCKSHLEEHERIHTGEKPFQCDICGVYFRTLSSCKSHIRGVHKQQLPAGCGINDVIRSEDHRVAKTSGQGSRMASPIRAPMSEAPRSDEAEAESIPWEPLFKCHFCDKTSLRQTCIIQHERQHTGERPFSCRCGKAFPAASTLKKHQRDHCTLAKEGNRFLSG
ncbi:zinc finger protein 420-like [Acanthaster planci]|uniref:Zinc finger protein 865 n=1 Tax=Acanthaster planci TaxID=133434 RepID=A0A8B7ZVS9_ACAPL|nr:zinc finger protein 420-like [Acanthaster planci]